MNFMRLTVALLMSAFALPACQPVTTQAEADLASIRALPKAWGTAMASENIPALVSLRADDVVRMPPDGPVAKGKPPLEDFYRGLFEQFSVEGNWPVEGTEEIVIADGWAFHASEYTLRLRPKDGGETTEIHGKIIAICRQQPDGTWKIAREIWN